MRTLIVVLLLLLGASVAHAIPPFARRYGMACSTCHVGGPTKLTAFGEAFRDNGYRIPGDDQAYLREPPLPLGAPERAALFPRTVWPGQLPAYVPIGLAGQVGVDGTIAPPGAKSTLAFPASLALLAGGSFGRHLSFFGVLQGGTDGIALNQLVLVGRSLFERWLGETRLNLKAGLMDLDLFPVQPSLRRTLLPFLTESLAVGRDGFTLAAPVPAIEAWGLLGGRVKWVVGVANGAKPITDTKGRRDLFGRVSIKIGGPRLDYRGVTPAQAESATTLSLGASAYWGLGVVEPPPPELRFGNDIQRFAADARLRSHGLDVIGRVVYGQDSDPDGLAVPVRHLAWLAEADYELFPWLQPYARFEEARFDSASHPDRRRLVLGWSLFVRTNLRLTFEGAAGLSSSEAHRVIVQAFFGI
jgi:hypothetical protein